MRKRRILLIDDQPIFREPIAQALSALGYHVTTAATGLDGLDTIKQNSMAFDLILLDFSMPEMSGLSFLDKLRKSAWGDVPVVMLTSLAEKEIVVAARNLGVKDYVLKSKFSMDELVKVIHKYQ